MSKCCVCKKEENCIAVKSTCSSKVLTYCQSCLTRGYEAYEELVACGLVYECLSPSMRERIVNPTLKYFNKTVEQFNAEVEMYCSRKDLE